MDKVQRDFITEANELYLNYCAAMCKLDLYTYLKAVPEFTEKAAVNWSESASLLIGWLKKQGETEHANAIESICAHWATQANQQREQPNRF